MGTLHTNIYVRSSDYGEVVVALEQCGGLPAYVSQPCNAGWVSVYLRATKDQIGLQQLTQSLSWNLATVVVGLLAEDSELHVCVLADSGEIHNAFDTVPTVRAGTKFTEANFAPLQQYCVEGTSCVDLANLFNSAGETSRILIFEKMLGIPPGYAGTSYAVLRQSASTQSELTYEDEHQNVSCSAAPPTLKVRGIICGVTRAQTRSAQVRSLGTNGQEVLICEPSHVAAWYGVVANSGGSSQGLRLTLRGDASAESVVTPISASVQHFNSRAAGLDPGQALLSWARKEVRFTRQAESKWTAEIDFEYKHLLQIGFLFCPLKSGQALVEIDLQPLDPNGTSEATFNTTILVQKPVDEDQPGDGNFEYDVCHIGVEKREHRDVTLTPWGYFAEFDNDINSALQKMRQLEFERKYSDRHVSMEEALKNGEDEASCTIMKIRAIGTKRGEGVSCPLWKKALNRIFGSDKPTLDMLGQDIDDAYEILSSEWNFFGYAESFYIVFYTKRVLQGEELLVPSTIFFGGWMYDL